MQEDVPHSHPSAGCPWPGLCGHDCPDHPCPWLPTPPSHATSPLQHGGLTPSLHTTAGPAGFGISASCRQKLFVFTFILNIMSLSLISHPWSVEGTSRSELTFRLCVRHLYCQLTDNTFPENDLWTLDAPALLCCHSCDGFCSTRTCLTTYFQSIFFISPQVAEMPYGIFFKCLWKLEQTLINTWSKTCWCLARAGPLKRCLMTLRSKIWSPIATPSLCRGCKAARGGRKRRVYVCTQKCPKEGMGEDSDQREFNPSRTKVWYHSNGPSRASLRLAAEKCEALWAEHHCRLPADPEGWKRALSPSFGERIALQGEVSLPVLFSPERG